MRTPSKARTQRQATMHLPRLPRESKPQTEKTRGRFGRGRRASTRQKAPARLRMQPMPARRIPPAKANDGSKARRIQHLEQREHRKRPTTRATQKQVRHNERIEYAHALPFSTRQRRDAPVRCHIVAIRCVKYSRSAASETMPKKSPECPVRSRCISNKCTATAKKPTLSSRLFVSDPRCMKSLRATDSQSTRWQQPWCWQRPEQLPSSRRCEQECSRTQRPRCCATR